MSDDTNRIDGDRDGGGDGYEAIDLARKYDITTEEARDLIKRIGNDRDALDRAAQAFKEDPGTL